MAEAIIIGPDNGLNRLSRNFKFIVCLFDRFLRYRILHMPGSTWKDLAPCSLPSVGSALIIMTHDMIPNATLVATTEPKG